MLPLRAGCPPARASGPCRSRRTPGRRPPGRGLLTPPRAPRGLGHHAAVHAEDVAGHVGGLVREEPQDSDLVGLPAALHRNTRLDAIDAARLAACRVHRGVDMPRPHAIDPDALLGDFLGLREVLDHVEGLADAGQRRQAREGLDVAVGRVFESDVDHPAVETGEVTERQLRPRRRAAHPKQRKRLQVRQRDVDDGDGELIQSMNQ